MPTIRFLMDENVPREVGDFLRQRGHDVIEVGDHLAKASPDPLLLLTAEFEGRVVVTFDRDFRRMLRQLPEGSRTRVRRSAGRISLQLREEQVLNRIQDQIEVIEFHYDQAMSRGARFILHISQTTIQIVT